MSDEPVAPSSDPNDSPDPALASTGGSRGDTWRNAPTPATRGDETVPVATKLMPRFDIVVATQDWHPKDHRSFAVNNPGKQVGELGELGGLPQVMWPAHCVQGTRGADLHESLERSKITAVFRKGIDAGIDSYSGFYDNGHKKATGLGDWLKQKRVDKLYVLGLATDYCVKFTCLDAKELAVNGSGAIKMELAGWSGPRNGPRFNGRDTLPRLSSFRA